MKDFNLSEFQINVLNLVIDKINNRNKHILIEMPIGSGKTYIIKKIIESLLLSSYNNSINILFQSTSLVHYFQSTLSDNLSAFQIQYEYNRRSIKIRLQNVKTNNELPIYFIDDFFSDEVATILKIKNAIVVGFYSNVSEKIHKSFNKKHIDYSLSKNELVDLKGTYKNTDNPKDLLSKILDKLSIKNNSKEDLIGKLISLDLWVDDFVTNQKSTNLESDKNALLETFVTRKEAVEEFEKMLKDEKYFLTKKKNGKGEIVWQNFFEKNRWIFGLNLNLYFLSSLDEKKLEQVVSGFDFNSKGKRVDGLLKSSGILSSFYFCEIKTHKTEILQKGKPYRADSYSISKELAGAVSQTQKTVLKATNAIKGKQIIKDIEGYDSNEIIYNYVPQASIVIGSLSEFFRDGKINEERYASFELFRKSLQNIQIITFDELYCRAEAILGGTKQELK